MKEAWDFKNFIDTSMLETHKLVSQDVDVFNVSRIQVVNIFSSFYAYYHNNDSKLDWHWLCSLASVRKRIHFYLVLRDLLAAGL